MVLFSIRRLGMFGCLVLLGLTGCTTVEPWERGNLAKPQMAAEAHPMQSAVRAHIHGSREAGGGGQASEGGGCGCY